MINKNRGWCLLRSIKSVISQLKDNDELHLVDDNSNDNSKEIMSLFSDQAIISDIFSNGNLSRARNTAVSHSKGDILLFLDSDVALLPGSLEIIRKAFDNPEVVGASGTVFGNNHDKDQFEIISHISINEFAEMFDSNANILYEYPQFFDYRWHNPEITENTANNWKFFFGGFNASRKYIYTEIGGFDEGFTKWGSEDIELGYRLNQKGQIVYCRNAVVFHHSHERDYFGYSRSNMENLYFLLSKHPSFEIEIFCAFKLDANPTRMDSLKRMCNTVAQYNKLSSITLNEKDAIIHFPTQEHPYGYVEYKENNSIKSYDLFGFAIPVVNKFFNRVYVTSAYHALPDFLVSMVLQEAVRVSDTVLAVKAQSKCPPIFYGEPGFYNGSPVFQDTFFINQDYSSFIIEEYDNDYFMVKPNPATRVSITGRE